MNILHYTNRNLSILLFFLIGIWGISFYYMVAEEVTDETDDTLEHYRDIIVSKALQEPEMLDSQDNILHSYSISPISDEMAEDYEETYYDASIYIDSEDEEIPVRVMKSCFRAPDDRFYELELRISTMERDDMIESLFYYLIALYVLLLLCTMIGMRVVLKKVFVPLQKLLAWLDSIIPGKPVPALVNETKISEFRKLNDSAVAMSRRSEQAYEEQKQFIENASHELQTPLAISRSKLELLAESEGLTGQQLADIDELYRTLGRAVKLNKSLLLLSRINNGQFPDTKEVNINEMVKEIMSDLTEVYDYKELNYSLEEPEVCIVRMNESLAHILLVNLLKNALIHTPKRGTVNVVIRKDRLCISNSGDKPLNPEKIFRRFYRSDSGSKESTGLGLAISKSIADMYGIRLGYEYGENHTFVLKFVK